MLSIALLILHEVDVVKAIRQAHLPRNFFVYSNTLIALKDNVA